MKSHDFEPSQVDSPVLKIYNGLGSVKLKGLSSIFIPFLIYRLNDNKEIKIKKEEERRKPKKTKEEYAKNIKISLMKSLRKWGESLFLFVKTYCYFTLKLFYTIYQKRDNLGWAVVKYFSDAFNWLDIGSLLSLFFLIILRV